MVEVKPPGGATGRSGVRHNGRVPRTMAVANQKGGVAKTTTVATLGAALAERGQRVLLVDLDPQACLTFSVGIDPEDLDKSIHHVHARWREGARRARGVRRRAPDLLPATIELATVEVQPRSREWSGAGAADRVASTAARQYDWIIVDCPPTLGLLTVNGLSAASDVLIPLQCETSGASRRRPTTGHDPRCPAADEPRAERARRPADPVRRAHHARAGRARDDRRHVRAERPGAGDPEVDPVRRGAGDRRRPS